MDSLQQRNGASASSSSDEQQTVVDFPRMPIYVGNQTEESDLVQMQFFISEEAMNLGLRTLFESGALVKGHRIASTHIKTFIPNFEEVFGKHSDVFMLVEALTAPKITIS